MFGMTGRGRGVQNDREGTRSFRNDRIWEVWFRRSELAVAGVVDLFRVGDGGEASPAHLLVRACASW